MTHLNPYTLKKQHMDYLYHITKKQNLPSILTRGLISNSDIGGFVSKTHLNVYKTKYGTQPIFLTNDTKWIIDTQLTDEWMIDAVILKVDVTGLNLEYEYDYMVKGKMISESTEKTEEYLNSTGNGPNNPKTFICRGDISLGRIVPVI